LNWSAELKKRILFIVLTLAALALVAGLLFFQGWRRGFEIGQREGEALMGHIQAAEKKAALALIRSGAVERGVNHLEYSLDKDIIRMSDELRSLQPKSQARTNALGYLRMLADYRTKYPRPPNEKMESPFEQSKEEIRQRADHILKQLSLTPPASLGSSNRE
jgi:hypothetical protein